MPILCSTNSMMAIYEITTHAPKVFTVFFENSVFFILLRVAQTAISARGG